MKLSKTQIEYIRNRRIELDNKELEIRRIPEKERYGNENGDEYTRQLIAIYDEHKFFNHMIKLHNVEVVAQKALDKKADSEV